MRIFILFSSVYLHSTLRILSFCAANRIFVSPSNKNHICRIMPHVIPSWDARIVCVCVSWRMARIGKHPNRTHITDCDMNYLPVYTVQWHCRHRWHRCDSSTIAIKSNCMNVKWQMRFIQRTSAHVILCSAYELRLFHLCGYYGGRFLWQNRGSFYRHNEHISKIQRIVSISQSMWRNAI